MALSYSTLKGNHNCRSLSPVESLSFASYFSDHMVLQKSPESAVLWGYGREGRLVTVSLSGPVHQKTSPATVTGGKRSQAINPATCRGQTEGAHMAKTNIRVKATVCVYAC